MTSPDAPTSADTAEQGEARDSPEDAAGHAADVGAGLVPDDRTQGVTEMTGAGSADAPESAVPDELTKPGSVSAPSGGERASTQ
ncbi:MAG TPA: hypothetical protein VGD03_04895 [Frankiaceae bacterium]|jgi:hypothetical protein